MVLRALNFHSQSIANIHLNTLDGSFLSKMGFRFLTSLYSFLICKEVVLVSLENENVTGFVSFSSDSSKMMKKFFIYSPFCIIRIIGIVISSPVFIKRIAETFTVLFKLKTTQTKMGKVDLPSAELLSISVDPTCQKTGIGKQLLQALEDHLRENSIKKYKVIAGSTLESANSFYKKNGFILVSQVIIHGNDLSNIYVKEL